MPTNNSNRTATIIDEYVGSRLKSLRMDRGVSLNELGELVDVSYQQIQKYENGSNRISVGRLWDFCKVFEVVPNYFFLGLWDKNEGRFHDTDFIRARHSFRQARTAHAALNVGSGTSRVLSR